MQSGCFRYHKGTDFQANHNHLVCLIGRLLVVLDTTKVQIFKQITTTMVDMLIISGCFRYHKGTDFQANHNRADALALSYTLFQIPQRYRFSSKSQPNTAQQTLPTSCFRYHKGTDFQANHNALAIVFGFNMLFQIPQRYRFSSKSQHGG